MSHLETFKQKYFFELMKQIKKGEFLVNKIIHFYLRYLRKVGKLWFKERRSSLHFHFRKVLLRIRPLLFSALGPKLDYAVKGLYKRI